MTPDAIFTRLVEDLGAALIAGDFDRYMACVTLPLVVENRAGKDYLFETESALEADFDLYHDVLSTARVTQLIRRILKVEQTSETVILGHFETHMMSNATRIVNPWIAKMQLAMTPHGWRICRIISSLGHINWSVKKGQILPDGSFQGDAVKPVAAVPHAETDT